MKVSSWGPDTGKQIRDLENGCRESPGHGKCILSGRELRLPTRWLSKIGNISSAMARTSADSFGC